MGLDCFLKSALNENIIVTIMFLIILNTFRLDWVAIYTVF
jgi:hypothetical protein